MAVSDILQSLTSLVTASHKLVTDTTSILKRYYLSSANRQAVIAVLKDIDAGEGTVTQQILRMVKPAPPPPPPPVVATAPVVGAAVVATNQVTVPLTTASFSLAGIDHYEVWATNGASGTETYRGVFNTWPYIVNEAAGTWKYKFKGVDPTAVGTPSTAASPFSNEVTAVVGGVLNPDTHPPAVPSAPTIVSGGGAVLDSVAKATPTADTAGGPYGEVTSGAKQGKWYKSGVYQAGYDSLVPSQSAETLQQIGAQVTTPGTDIAGVVTGPVCPVGVDSHWGTADQALSYKTSICTGKVTETVQVDDADAGAAVAAHWTKPFVWGFRASANANDCYADLIVFNKNGEHTVGVEGRIQINGSATKLGNPFLAYTLPFLARRSCDPDLGIVTFEFNQDITAVAPWQTLFSGNVPGLGKTYLSGRGAAGYSSATTASYSTLVKTVDPDVRFPFTGSQVSTGPTIIPITFAMEDNAGNVSAAAVDCSFTYAASSVATNLPGLFPYTIGPEPRYCAGPGVDTDTVLRMSKNAGDVINIYGGWEGRGVTVRQLFAAVMALNPDWIGGRIYDITLNNTGFANFVVAYKWYPVKDDGVTEQLSTGGFSGFHITNWSAPSGLAGSVNDPAGRNAARAAAAYVIDAIRDGGAAGLSQQGEAPNDLVRFFYNDDTYGYLWQTGQWTPNNVNANALLQAGQASFFYYIQNPDRAGTPNSLLRACNSSQFNPNNQCPAAYYGMVDLIVMESIGSLIGDFSNLLATIQEQRKMLVSTGKAIFSIYDCQIIGEGAALFACAIAFIMGSEYVAPQNGSGNNPIYASYVASTPWFDSFDIDLATHQCKTYPNVGKGWNYLGAPQSAGKTSAWKQGVWRMDFDNAIIIANPTTNGVQNVTLDGTFYKPQSATYAPFNGGGPITSITIQPGTAYILLR